MGRYETEMKGLVFSNDSDGVGQVMPASAVIWMQCFLSPQTVKA